jgi:hypothetical protein
MKPDLVSEIVTGQNNSNLTPDATSVAEGGSEVWEEAVKKGFRTNVKRELRP